VNLISALIAVVVLLVLAGVARGQATTQPAATQPERIRFDVLAWAITQVEQGPPGNRINVHPAAAARSATEGK
jgi:hypothetical protein